MSHKSFRKAYPHLHGVQELEGLPGLGMCIHRAAAFVLDVPGAVMVMAVCPACTPEELAIQPRGATEPFIHAWAEYKGGVFAPTQLQPTGVRLVPRPVYYDMQRPTQTWIITRPEVLAISGRIGLSSHLRKATPAKASVGETFLDHAGIKWALSEDGGLIPAPE